MTTSQRRIREEAFGGRVDREAGIIRDCAILGSGSANGRVYEATALNRAVELYEGKIVRLNHRPMERRDLVDDIGILKNIRRRGDKVRGDFHILLSHPLAEFILERAERFPSTFGFSHEADGSVEEGADGKEHVLDLLHVESVDLVGTPATNSGLFESLQANDVGAYGVTQLFRDHGFEPTPEELATCCHLPERLRDGYVDHLRLLLAGEPDRSEMRALQERLSGTARDRPPLLAEKPFEPSEAFSSELIGVDIERHTAFVASLRDGD